VQQFLRDQPEGRWPLVAMPCDADAGADGDVCRAQWCTQAQLRRLRDGAPMRAGMADPPALRVLRIDTHNSGDAGVRTLVPADATEFRTALVRDTHRQLAHAGKYKMLQHLKHTAWHLEGVNELVADVVRLCDVCATSKFYPPAASGWQRADDTGKLGAHHLVPTAFNDIVHADHVGALLNGDGTASHILSMTDGFTRWPEAVVVPDLSARTTVDAIHRLWISRYGPPARLVSDRGGAFVNGEVEEMAKAWGIELVRTTSHHAQSNGLEERAHGSLLSMLRADMLQRGVAPERWPDALSRALFAMRATANRVTGESPARLVLGYEIAPGAVRAAGSDVETRDADRLRMQARQLERAAQSAAQQAAAAAAAGSRAPPFATIGAGDYVRIYMGNNTHNELNPKLQLHRWSEPWRVAERRLGHALVVTKAADPNVVRVVSAMNCNPTHLPADRRAAYDKLYADTLRAKDAEQRRRDVLHTPIEWRYEADGGADAERVELDEVVDRHGDKVRVRWANGELTWEPRAVIAADAPDVLRAYEERNTSKARAKGKQRAAG
jgi:transposase InsO family protein